MSHPSHITIADAGHRLRLWRRTLFAAVWLVPGLLASVAQWVAVHGSADAIAFPEALAWQVSAWLLWALWSQLILTLVDRVPFDAKRLGPWLGTHLAGSVIVISAHLLTVTWVDWRFAPWMRAVERFEDALRLSIGRHLDLDVMLYGAILGAAYLIEYLLRYRERDRAATELEQRLSRQQLEALRMQLNPHFLFNALNSVTELMEDDVRGAQRALIAVSDLLRLSLRTAAQPTIPLWQEVELIELYLQVARVRYGDGLTIDIDVDPAAVDVDVPSFVLQPLVENALKHGLSPGRIDQSVRIVVRRSGATLELVVADNGRGLDGRLTDSGRFLAAQPDVRGLGIGLTNTRTRLAMLYGDRYTFRMANAPDGGCLVEIRLPVGA
ncbi:MAG: histidine kinase [Gemmatimonadaceae bacterium]|nr:histidine kinase [Gemmatimonadaceae bacterium]